MKNESIQFERLSPESFLNKITIDIQNCKSEQYNIIRLPNKKISMGNCSCDWQCDCEPNCYCNSDCRCERHCRCHSHCSCDSDVCRCDYECRCESDCPCDVYNC